MAAVVEAVVAEATVVAVEAAVVAMEAAAVEAVVGKYNSIDTMTDQNSQLDFLSFKLQIFAVLCI